MISKNNQLSDELNKEDAAQNVVNYLKKNPDAHFYFCAVNCGVNLECESTSSGNKTLIAMSFLGSLEGNPFNASIFEEIMRIKLAEIAKEARQAAGN